MNYMKNVMPKILFMYCAVASFLITVSTIFTAQTMGSVIFATLFLPVAAYFIIEFFKQMHSLLSPKPTEGSDLGSPPKKGEFVIMLLIFLILLGVGIRNIMISAGQTKNIDAQSPTPAPSGLIFKTAASPTPSPQMLTVLITDGATEVNLRAKPTIYSDKVGTAKNGDKFEYIALSAGWYQIKLPDGSPGYIAAKYTK